MNSSMKQSFEFQRVMNPRLYLLKDQEYDYEKYLNRIEKIVDRASQQDHSSSYYMELLKKSHEIARTHQSHEKRALIEVQNGRLLKQILKLDRRDNPTISQTSFHVPFHEKRCRQQDRINEENRQIAHRVISQPAKIDQKLPKGFTPLPRMQSTLYQSRLKTRKLPKIAHFRG